MLDLASVGSTVVIPKLIGNVSAVEELGQSLKSLKITKEKHSYMANK